MDGCIDAWLAWLVGLYPADLSVRSFVRSFVRWLEGLFVCLLAGLFVCLLAGLFVCLLAGWLVCLFVC